MQFTTLLRLGRRVGVAARDDNIYLPMDCIPSCEAAYFGAKEVGKTPSICPDDSDFMRHYKDCNSCILAKAENPREVINVYIDPKISPYISYCQEIKSIDPTWYTSTTFYSLVTYTDQLGPAMTVVAEYQTTVLRPDWTGFPTTTSVSPTTTITTTATTRTTGASPSSQANTITSSQPFTTINPTPDKSSIREAKNGPSPWVWAIVGAVIALTLIGLGILLFLYRKGKLRFIKKKLGMASAHSHSHELDGDSTWRTGDKPELHGESSSTAAAVTSSKELYTEFTEPRELDSSVRPVELAVDDTVMRAGVVELPAEIISDDGGVTRDLTEDGGGEKGNGEHR